MPTVLVTGGAGYIGSHAAKALAHSGFEPVVLDNLRTGNRWAVKWGDLVVSDLTEAESVHHILRRYSVVAILHLAGDCYVGESVLEPRRYFRNNVATALNLLDTALDVGVRYFVFSSSCAVYGVPSSIPIQENHPQVPVSPYGESKLFIERVLRWYATAYSLRWAALRYFNAAGADLQGEIGESHDPETHLIPLSVAAAAGRNGYVEIYGTDYPTPDGTAIRDYTHVADLADAHVRTLIHLLDGGDSIALNLGTGEGHSVREVINAVEKVSGRRIPTRESHRRAGDPPELVADSRMAADILSWQPKRPELERIVESAWRWEEHGRHTRKE